ncbi:MAG: Gfo/Idh/MocA family oxidoreductase [Clostridia bacterium]|nr:Gfo/Idh/MocA family oxidoreductase [Clostridia bacterium]
MKTIGFIDYYISEWHANNYVGWFKEVNEKLGDDFVVKYAWAEMDKSPLDDVTTDQWCEKYGVTKCDTIEELCEKADYILILSPSDPEKHLGYAEKALKYKKNTYIDKTFAPDYKTAKAIFDIAEKYGTKFFSSSALRYTTELNNFKNVKSVITTGGGGNMPEYVIHQIEMAVKLLDAKALEIKVEKVGESQYISNVKFSDDKQASIVFSPSNPFAVITQSEDGEAGYAKAESDFFKGLLEDILRFYNTGVTSFDVNQTLEVMKVREGVIKGMDNCGAWIKL